MSRKRNHSPRIYADRSQYKAGPSYLLQGLLIHAGYLDVGTPSRDVSKSFVSRFVSKLKAALASFTGR